MANNIPNNVPTAFEVQDRSIRNLNKVLTIHIYEHFDTLQDQLAIEERIVETIRHFLSLLIRNEPIPVPTKYYNEFDAHDYIAKGIASHVMLYCLMGNLDPLVVIDVVIRELHTNILLINE